MYIYVYTRKLCFRFKRHSLFLPPPFLPQPQVLIHPFAHKRSLDFGPGGSCIPVRCSRSLLVASSPLICLLCFPKAHRRLTLFCKAVSRPAAVPGAEQPSPSLRPSDTHTQRPTHKDSSGWEVARKQTASPPAASSAAPRLTNILTLALELGFTSLFSTWTMILDDVT